MTCPGIEVEPGVHSGCTAAETGARDCPTCGPYRPCPSCGQPELDVVLEALGVCDECNTAPDSERVDCDG